MECHTAAGGGEGKGCLERYGSRFQALFQGGSLKRLLSLRHHCRAFIAWLPGWS